MKGVLFLAISFAIHSSFSFFFLWVFFPWLPHFTTTTKMTVQIQTFDNILLEFSPSPKNCQLGRLPSVNYSAICQLTKWHRITAWSFASPKQFTDHYFPKIDSRMCGHMGLTIVVVPFNPIPKEKRMAWPELIKFLRKKGERRGDLFGQWHLQLAIQNLFSRLSHLQEKWPLPFSTPRKSFHIKTFSPCIFPQNSTCCARQFFTPL